MTPMDITIHSSLLPHDDPEATLAFYRDTLGFEVRLDVEYGGMHWITVGPADQPGTSIVLYPPEATPGLTDDERRTIAEMMAKGTYASLNLATRDLDATFERLQAGDATSLLVDQDRRVVTADRGAQGGGQRPHLLRVGDVALEKDEAPGLHVPEEIRLFTRERGPGAAEDGGGRRSRQQAHLTKQDLPEAEIASQKALAASREAKPVTEVR